MSKKGKKKKKGSSENPGDGGGASASSASTAATTAMPATNASNENHASTMTNAASDSQSSQKIPKLQKNVLLEKEKGIAAFKKNDLISALTAFSKAIVLTPIDHPTLPSLYTQRALCYLRLDNHEAAIEDATHALKLNPKYVKAYVCRGVGYFRSKQFQYANDDYTTASKLQLGNARFQEALATTKKVALESSKDFLMDTTIFDTLLLSIDDSEALFNNEPLKDEGTKKTPTQQPQQQPTKSSKGDKSKVDYSDLPPLVPVGEFISTPLTFSGSSSGSNAITPQNPQKLIALSVREKELGNHAFTVSNFLVALDHYTKAIRLNPKEPVFFSNRALVYLKLGRYYESITDASISIERKPSIKAHARRAAAWAALKEHILAVEDYKQALEFEPKNLECLQEYYRCLGCLETEYRLKLQSNPHNDKCKDAIRATKEEMKIVDARIQNVQKQSASPPQQAPVDEPMSGTVPSSKADLDALISHYTTDIAKDSTNSEAYLRRGQIYLQKGDFEKAMIDFRNGLYLDPDHKELQRVSKIVKARLAGK